MRACERADWQREWAACAWFAPWTIAGSLLLTAVSCNNDESGGAKAVGVARSPGGDASVEDGFDAGAGGAGGDAAQGGPQSGSGSSDSGSGGIPDGPAASSRGGGSSPGGAGSATAMGYVAMPLTLTTACDMCEKRWPVCWARRKACLSATGMAAAGPKAGSPESELCRDTLACLYNTNCADVMTDKLACLCGVGLALDQCVTSGAVGMCAGELEASAETIEPLDISTRLADPGYAAGLAFRTLQCAERYCAKSCGLCATSNPMCADVEPGMEPAP